MKDFLRTRRNELKLTLDEMGKKMDVTKSAISYYEHGNRFPTIDNLWKLKKAYELTDEELWDWLKFINKGEM